MEQVQKLILEENFEQALAEVSKQDLSIARVLVERGRALAGLGKFDKAADDFLKAAELYKGLEIEAQRKIEKLAQTAQPAEEAEEAPIIIDETPLPRPKFDWYQSPTHLFVSVVAKKVQPSDLSVKISENEVEVVVQNKLRLVLTPFAMLDPASSSYQLNEFKVELKLSKRAQGNWTQLEGAKPVASLPGVNLPTPYASGKSAKDWSKLEKEAEAEAETEGDPLNNLLKKIYKDADEDTRRAMMKSYQTSNGTILTTNWKEAGTKDFTKEIKPPKGQLYKNWEGDVISRDDE